MLHALSNYTHNNHSISHLCCVWVGCTFRFRLCMRSFQIFSHVLFMWFVWGVCLENTRVTMYVFIPNGCDVWTCSAAINPFLTNHIIANLIIQWTLPPMICTARYWMPMEAVNVYTSVPVHAIYKIQSVIYIPVNYKWTPLQRFWSSFVLPSDGIFCGINIIFASCLWQWYIYQFTAEYGRLFDLINF